MKLSSGTRLGPYEIVAHAGAGAMGEVYRARDTRLDRTVAIKVLPGEFSADARLRVRFEREAKAISALNHPHICALHDVGRENGVDYLVMEYCEGKTLADRIAEGALPLSQVLQYGIEIADALDKAHRQGIIHRDLKPANIMLTKSGVKLLDFGLAKQRIEVLPAATTVQRVTEEGHILGTIQYMAPELLSGGGADARSDIFALGLVLYEMTTGKPAFTGASKASLIAAILEHEPIPLAELKPASPPALDRLIRACLAKDPDERIQTAHDVMLELRWIVDGVSSAPIAAGRASALPWTAAAIAIAIAIIGSIFVWRSAHRKVPSRLNRTSIIVPFPAEVGNRENVAISSDGSLLAYTAERTDGKTQIYLRALNQLEATPISGTENGGGPFFSPNGQWLGFEADGKLRKLPISGGTPVTICDLSNLRGATWGPDDTIVFATRDSSLLRVPASGGSPTPITRAERTWVHRYPTFLPDGRHVLFTEYDSTHLGYEADADETRNVAVVDIQTGSRKVVMRSAWYGRYASTGHLLFIRDDVVYVAPFDSKRLEVTGTETPLLSDVGTYRPAATAFFAVSADGTVAYVPAIPEPDRDLVWIDRKGVVQPISNKRPIGAVAYVSPEGLRIVAQSKWGKPRDLWLYDLVRDSWTRLTFEADNFVCSWSPDGTQILFVSNRTPPYNLYIMPANRTASATQITHQTDGVVRASWSGRTVAFDTQVAGTGFDIWTMNIDDAKGARPFLNSRFDEYRPALSPDSHWIAYISEESGRDEVYVQPYPGPGPKWPISSDGAVGIPKWSKDGRTLYYRNGDKLLEVDIQTTPTFKAAKPRVLFEIPFASFDVAPDGRFLLVRDTEKPQPPREIRVVQGLLTPAD